MENKLNKAGTRVYSGSKPKEFYGEGYFLRAEGSNYGRCDSEGRQLFTPYEEQYYYPRNKQFATFLIGLFKPKTALVLGCARGYMVKALRDLAVDALGIDISEWAIENSPLSIRGSLYVGDICDLSKFSNQAFDVTIGFDVMEHITVPDLYIAIDEAVRVTRSTIILDLPVEKDDLHPDQSSGTDKSHVSVYSSNWWVNQFKQRNFILKGIETYPYPEGSKGCLMFLTRKPTFKKSVITKAPVDLVMVNYNGLAYTPKCVETLYRNTSRQFNLIVVDNQSTDGSAEWLDFACHSYPNMKVILSETLNSGFAEGVNIGLRLAKSPYVCLLNNDLLFLQKDWLPLLVEALEKAPERGIVSPKLLYPDGRIQYAGATFDEKGNPVHIGRFKPAELYSKEREIPWATFACVLMRQKLLKGGLDTEYLLGTFEDVDFCTRTRLNGYQVWYCPQATLYHYEGATSFTIQRDHWMMQQQANARLFMKRWVEWLRLNRFAEPEVYAQ